MSGTGPQVTSSRSWSRLDQARGGDLVSTLPGCVWQKGKDMGPFSAPSE